MDDMNCKDYGALLHGYLDNELDTGVASRVRGHLDRCASCRAKAAELGALRKSLREHLPYHDAPSALAGNIMKQIRAQAPAPEHASGGWGQWFAPVFSLAALAMALMIYVAVPPGEQLADEVLSSHIRSLMEQHLTDVVSSDKHTVKPWFTGKLDFAPPVYDFTDKDYPLLGGRLDYIHHQKVAALSYRRNKHIINVFIMPDAGADSGLRTESLRGYNITSWKQNHMAFIGVSDLNKGELEQLGTLIMNESK